MSGWKTVKAGEYCFNVTDGTHDSPKRVENGKYLITTTHLNQNGLDFSSAYKISQGDYGKVITRSKVDQWDIMFSMIGTIGRIYQEQSMQTDYAIKNVGLFKFNGDKQKSDWLRYYLQSPKAHEYILSHLRGSTQGYIPLQALREMPILIPPLPTQRAIAATLSCLDDKIELNNRINANLEAQAQAIFKSWFVDFEPFKGGEFVDSELGRIP
jgi:type I restriction enzyme S subunit